MSLLRAFSPARSCVRTMAAALLLVVAMLAGSKAAAESPSLEYQIKASYIFNFAKFVEWPAPGPDEVAPETLNMCFLDDRKFGDALDKLSGQKLGKSTIAVLRPDPAAEQPIAGCNLVFVGEALSSRQDELLADAKNLPVLTIGESSEFLESGGIFEFVRKRGKILFRISAKNAKAAKLVVDPQLLGLAIEVQ